MVLIGGEQVVTGVREAGQWTSGGPGGRAGGAQVRLR